MYTYLEFSEENSSDHQIMQSFVKPSPVYSVLYQFPEADTISTTIYDQEMYGSQTVKLIHTKHNVAH